MDENYEVLISIINETLDARGIDSLEISRCLNVPKQEILLLRNSEKLDKNLLFDCLDYIIPSRSQQTIRFVKKLVETYSTKHLRNMLNNQELITEMNNLQLTEYEREAILNEIHHRFVVKTTCQQLRESRNLQEGFVMAGVDGLVGGAAMVAGSMLAKKVSDRYKLKQIEELEDQKRELRLQMRKKADDEFGKESLRKQIATLNAKIERIRSS
jgi:hypothetical protein